MAAELIQEALRKTKQSLNQFPPILEREFLQLDHTNSKPSFRVMQWNVLADALSSSSPTENFIKCPQEALNWKNRSQRSLEEILTYEADIICLEEVDHFNDCYLPALESVGYAGLFKEKKNSPCLNFAGNSGSDGCALFYNKHKFALEEVIQKDLKELSGCLTNQVALIAKLRFLKQMKSLVCAVTHLKAKPEFEKLRLEQGMDILKSISLLKDSDSSVILCGDFNAEPSEPVCDLMKENAFKLPLMSANQSALGHEADFTTWKLRPSGEVKHTIDYIFHSKDLAVAQCLMTPDVKDVRESLLPCIRYPSDHVALVFEFFWL